MTTVTLPEMYLTFCSAREENEALKSASMMHEMKAYYRQDTTLRALDSLSSRII